MKKNVIVSLADANYFPLLEELINSIKRFKESENIAICILDAGLTQEQKDILRDFDHSIDSSKTDHRPNKKSWTDSVSDFFKRISE